MDSTEHNTTSRNSSFGGPWVLFGVKMVLARRGGVAWIHFSF